MVTSSMSGILTCQEVGVGGFGGAKSLSREGTQATDQVPVSVCQLLARHCSLCQSFPTFMHLLDKSPGTTASTVKVLQCISKAPNTFTGWIIKQQSCPTSFHTGKGMDPTMRQPVGFIQLPIFTRVHL